MPSEENNQAKDSQFTDYVNNVSDQRQCEVFRQVVLFVTHWVNLVVVNSAKGEHKDFSVKDCEHHNDGYCSSFVLVVKSEVQLV